MQVKNRMADQSLEILVKTLADTHGVEAVRDALKSVGRSGSEAMEQVKEGTEKVHVSHRALHAALRQLGPEFSHLGHTALYAFANPVTAAIIGVALGVGLIRKHFTDAAKEAEETAKRIEESLNKINGATRGAVDEIKKSDKAFKEWQQHLAEDSGQAVKDLEFALVKLREQVKLQTELNKMRGGPESVPETLEAGAAGTERHLTQTAILQAAVRKKQAEDAAKSAQDQLQKMEQQRREASVSVEEHKKRAEQALKGSSPGIGELLLNLLPIPGVGDWRKLSPKALREREESGLSAQQRELSKADEQSRRLEGLTRKHASLETALAQSKKAVEDNNAQLKSLTEKLAMFEAKEGTRAGVASERTRQALGGMGYQPGSRLGATLLQDVEIANMISAGGQATDAQKQQLKNLANWLRSHGIKDEAYNKAFKDLFNLNISVVDKMEEFISIIVDLQTRVQAIHVP